jgi:2-enoate reductase
MSFDSIFTPVKIGSVELKNRVIMCAMGGTSPFVHGGYSFNEKVHDYCIERAKGNVGLIIPGVTNVKEAGQYLYQAEETVMGPLKSLVDELHTYGTKYFLQLGIDFGRVFMIPVNPENELVAASDGMPNVWYPDQKHRGLTVAEIEDYIDAFGKAALLCKKAGIDGVEIHAVHEGYLFDQFTIANTNKRTDEYGGSLENRFRFVTSVIKEIKKTCGKEFPVMIRYSVASKMRGFNQGALPGEDYVEFGRSMEESPSAARLLESAGADALNADNGSYDSWFWAHPPVYMPLACNLPEVSYIKNFVNIPVFCAGRMEDPEIADKAIASGAIDGIGVARQFLADPYWLNKVRDGHLDDIRPCIACHNGCFSISAYKGNPCGYYRMASCAVNPAAMDEANHILTPATQKKNIAVVGGGIGGMEAAMIAAQRGHQVTLYEQSGELGGVFIAAAAPDFKEKDKQLIQWYIKQVKALDIDIRLNTTVTPELLKGADEIVLAVGATPRCLPTDGLAAAMDAGKAMEAIEYLRGRKSVGNSAVIIGGGLTGIEIAYDLALKGKKTTVVEMQDDILKVPGLCASNSNMLREIVRYYNIGIMLENSLSKVTTTDDGVAVEVIDAEGNGTILHADNLIMSVGYIPRSDLAAQLKEAGISESNIHVVGDAHKVSNLMNAIHEAYQVAVSI